MIIIPIHKKITAKNFPAVTLLLVLVNCVVYFGLQGDDLKLRKQAVDFYMHSALPQIEFPLFEAYLGRVDGERLKQFEEIQEQMSDTGKYWQLAMLESDRDFLRLLDADEVVKPNHPRFAQWKKARADYTAITARGFTQHYYLRYDEINPLTAFTHMFLHGSFGHLFGNMLFLVLLGILVEGALGSGLFLACYLLAGLFSGAVSLLVNWDAHTGSLGASGAIAGLMGLYAVLYGRRRVRFFYWLFVYFDYVTKPAIVLLPVWLGWEILQFFLDAGGGVAYEAHAGGITAGGVLAWGVLRAGWEKHSFLEEETQRDEDKAMFEAAMQDLAELRLDAARAKMQRLLPRHPSDREFLQRYFNVCKLTPGQPEFDDLTRRMLALPVPDVGARRFVRSTFREYYECKHARIGLAAEQQRQLATRFANWGYLAEAKALLDNLIKQHQTTGLAGALLAMGGACIAQGKQQAARYYLNQIIKHYPHSQESQAAKMQLARVQTVQSSPPVPSQS